MKIPLLCLLCVCSYALVLGNFDCIHLNIYPITETQQYAVEPIHGRSTLTTVPESNNDIAFSQLQSFNKVEAGQTNVFSESLHNNGF